jgi:hypothetical protein
VIDNLTVDGLKPDVSPMIVDAIANSIKADMGANDQVAILSGSRMIKVSFFNNKQYLLEEVAAIPGRLNTDHIERRVPGLDLAFDPKPRLTDYEALLLSDIETEMHLRLKKEDEANDAIKKRMETLCLSRISFYPFTGRSSSKRAGPGDGNL